MHVSFHLKNGPKHLDLVKNLRFFKSSYFEKKRVGINFETTKKKTKQLSILPPLRTPELEGENKGRIIACKFSSNNHPKDLELVQNLRSLKSSYFEEN